MTNPDNPNVEDTDFELLSSDQGGKGGFGAYIKSKKAAIMQNIRGNTLALDMQMQEKKMENDMVNIVIDMAFSISLEKNDLDEITRQEWFTQLDHKNQEKLWIMLQKRVDINQADENKRKRKDGDIDKQGEIYEKGRASAQKLVNIWGEMLESIGDLLDDANEALIDQYYETALLTARQVQEQIQYRKKGMLLFQTALNNTLFKLKQIKEIFSAEKSNMTTISLPDAIDITLRQRYKEATAIIGEAQAGLKKQTKEKIKSLAHPKQVIQGITGNRVPQYQGKLVVSLKNEEKILFVKDRTFVGSGSNKKQLLIVQQRDGEHLIGIFNTDGTPAMRVFIRPGYRIQGNKIFFKRINSEVEQEDELV